MGSLRGLKSSGRYRIDAARYLREVDRVIYELADYRPFEGGRFDPSRKVNIRRKGHLAIRRLRNLSISFINSYSQRPPNFDIRRADELLDSLENIVNALYEVSAVSKSLKREGEEILDKFGELVNL
jgi:hypothetical protein